MPNYDPIDWEITNDTHGRIVTCQRPILLGFETEVINVSHFKCELQIKDTDVTFDDWGWVDTGIRINAYSDEGGSFYQANLAPYVRNYFELSRDFVGQRLFGGGSENNDWNHMFRRQFRVKIWPVLYGTDDFLIELYENYKWNREFMVFDTNIKDHETTSIVDFDNIRMDDFVTGNCDGGYDCNTYGELDYKSQAFGKMLTNMPGIAAPGTIYDGSKLTMDLNDGWFPVVGIGYNFTDIMQFGMSVEVEKIDGTTVSAEWFQNGTGSPFAYTDTNNCDIMYFPYQLGTLDLFLTLFGGFTDPIFDANGDLVAKTVKILYNFYESGSLVRTSPSWEFDVSDKTEPCGERTRFIFKNSRGLIDFFVASGVVEKTVEMSGETYSTQSIVTSRSLSMNTHPGQHNNSNLWNTRIDKRKIITQLLPKDWGEWLEELISSPMVWVEIQSKGHENSLGEQTYLADNTRIGKRLQPIIIDKTSVKTYHTEENLFHLEFSYMLANENTTSKGF